MRIVILLTGLFVLFVSILGVMLVIDEEFEELRREKVVEDYWLDLGAEHEEEGDD